MTNKDIVYRIPLMSIEDTLVGIDKNPNYIKLLKLLTKNSGNRYTIEITLGRRWYPEIVTRDRWLAWDVIKKFAKMERRMSITELLTQLYKELEERGTDLNDFGINDDEDMLMFALRYLENNLEDAFFSIIKEWRLRGENK
jgi:hypothetical protein